MKRSTPRVRARFAVMPIAVTLAGLMTAALLLMAAPVGALAAAGPESCRPFTASKASVHAAAVRREVTLARLVSTLRAHRDPWAMNGGQISALQGASAGISALDDHIQSTCYSTAAALRTDATRLLTEYRVYWLRVPQTHQIVAADRMAEARARLGATADRLSGHVDGNAQAQSDLAAMNQALAAADASLGTVPTPSPDIAQVPGLAPAVDMTANVAVMKAARADLLTARAALTTARTAGLAVLDDLGA